MGVRRLLALMKGLPINSALHREVDPDGWHWDMNTEVGAATVELLDRMLAITEAINSKDGDGRIRKTIEITRPWHEKPAASSVDGLMALAQDTGGKIIRKRASKQRPSQDVADHP